MRTVATRSLSDIKSTKSLKIYGERWTNLLINKRIFYFNKISNTALTYLNVTIFIKNYIY